MKMIKLLISMSFILGSMLSIGCNGTEEDDELLENSEVEGDATDEDDKEPTDTSAAAIPTDTAIDKGNCVYECVPDLTACFSVNGVEWPATKCKTPADYICCKIETSDAGTK